MSESDVQTGKSADKDGSERSPDDSQKIEFDYFNLTLLDDPSADEIELRISVPLVNKAFADVKIILGAPTRIVGEGKEDYKMDISSDLHVTKRNDGYTGPSQLVSRDGLSWEIPSGYTGAGTVLLTHEPKVKDFLAKRFLPGHVFVDVGANLGAYSVRAAAWDMKVYSFEPNPENVRGLRRNLELNHLSVELLECALGSAEGRANFSPNGALSRITTSGEVGVPIRTLDSFELEQVDLLKVDVEGYELEVFQGARKTLERFHPALVVEMHHWIGAEKEAALFDILSTLQYRFHYLDRYSQGRHLAAIFAQATPDRG